jgi:uncharacterized membrane protein (UPF0127 family)
MLATLSALAVLAACSGRSGGPASADRPTRAPAATATPTFPRDRVTVRFDGGAAVRAEVAVTREQQLRGLMYREELGEDDGMLFLFPHAQTDGFWMKNTLIPLSIAYLRRTADRAYDVVAILDMEPCPPDAATCPSYPPGRSYEAALEVNAGWFERAGVEVGSGARVEGEIQLPSPAA